MSYKQVLPSEKHRAFLDEYMKLARKHAIDVDAVELLAVVSYVVGQTIALSDMRTMTSGMAMEIVMKNLMLGNGDTIATLGQSTETPQ